MPCSPARRTTRPETSPACAPSDPSPTRPTPRRDSRTGPSDSRRSLPASGPTRDGGPLAGKLLRESDGPVLLSRRGVGRVGEGSDGAQAGEVSGLVVRLAGEHGIHDLAWSVGMIEADGVSEFVEKSLVQEGPRGLLGEDDRGLIDKAVGVPVF